MGSIEVFGSNASLGDAGDCTSISPSGNWVYVPGDPNYGTSDFCVMKYEENDSSGTPQSQPTSSPWVSVSQGEAQTRCAALGTGYHLVTNEEWMSIAAAISGGASNRSAGTVGSSSFSRGHTDNSPGIACPASNDDSKPYLENDCSSNSSSQGEDNELSQGRIHVIAGQTL